MDLALNDFELAAFQLDVDEFEPVGIVHLRGVSPEVVTRPAGLFASIHGADVSVGLHRAMLALVGSHQLMKVAGTKFLCILIKEGK